MEGPIDKRSGRIFGPPGTKRLVYFIDDLNMPSVDQYNTQSPSCLLKQHMDYGSWFDPSKLEKVSRPAEHSQQAQPPPVHIHARVCVFVSH